MPKTQEGASTVSLVIHLYSMTPIICLTNGDGYLSENGLAEAAKFRAKTAQLVNCVLETVSLCHSNLNMLKNENQQTAEGQQRVFAGIVLARLLEVSEALLYLAKGGFGNEVDTIFRSFLEAYFLFGNVTNIPGFVPKYLEMDKCIRLKLINQAEKQKHELFRLMQEYATPSVKEKLKAEILATGAKELSTYQLAQAIGCEHIYDSMYRISSAVAHSSPRSLEPYVTENRDGVITEIKRGPALGSIPQCVYNLGCFLLKVNTSFNNMYSIDVTTQAGVLQSKLNSLVVVESR